LEFEGIPGIWIIMLVFEIKYIIANYKANES
jgi:hypothetical protein